MLIRQHLILQKLSFRNRKNQKSSEKNYRFLFSFICIDKFLFFDEKTFFDLYFLPKNTPIFPEDFAGYYKTIQQDRITIRSEEGEMTHELDESTFVTSA